MLIPRTGCIPYYFPNLQYTTTLTVLISQVVLVFCRGGSSTSIHTCHKPGRPKCSTSRLRAAHSQELHCRPAQFVAVFPTPELTSMAQLAPRQLLFPAPRRCSHLRLDPASCWNWPNSHGVSHHLGSSLYEVNISYPNLVFVCLKLTQPILLNQFACGVDLGRYLVWLCFPVSYLKMCNFPCFIVFYPMG